MGRQCEVSGKKTSFGNHVTTRGKAKYLGGVGTKCTGVSRRVFKPNLQRLHVWLPNGETRYVRVATSVIRTGLWTLEVDGNTIQSLPVSAAPNGSASVTFAPFTVASRNMRATVKLPPDALAHDNVFHFVVSPSEPVRAIVIDRAGADSEALYLLPGPSVPEEVRRDAADR